MKVLVVCRMLDAALALRLRPLATASGVEEVVVVRHRPGPDLPGVRYVCPPRWLRPRPLQVLAEAVLALVCAGSIRPDLVHGIYLVPHGLTAVLAARSVGRPSLVAVIGTDLHGHLERGPAPWRRLLVAVLERASRVVTTGTRSLARLEALGVDRRRLAVLPNGVDPEDFPGAGGEGEAPDLDLLFVGRLVEGKGPRRFVELAERVLRRRGTLGAALLGDGPERSAVEERVRELGMEGRVEVAGQVGDVARWLARSRLMVLPTRAEGLPYAAVEAMAAGVPPVVPPVGDVPDLVEDGRNGLLVEDFDDLERVAERVAALLDDDSARRLLGEAARDTVQRRFSLEAARRIWEALLAELAEPSP